MATIQGVYVALFGRPADPIGLAFFNGVTKNGADLSAIGDLAATKEYQDRFVTPGLNNAQIVNSIYKSLFNREAEPTGLNFFVDALNKGTLNINNIAVAILDGAQGSDKTIVDLKIATADKFTAAIDTPLEVATYQGNEAAASARDWLATVTTTAPTDAQIADAVLALNEGRTFTVAAAAAAKNVVVGTTASDTSDKNDTITATATATATTNVLGDDAWVFSSDKIDGGLGVDTFNVTIDASVTVIADGLKSIEVLNVSSADATGAINVAEAKQLTQVWNTGSTAALTVSGIALGTAVGIKDAVTASTFAFAGATGSSDAVTLTTNAVTGSTGVTIAAIETLTIANTGTSALGTVTAADATSVVLTGAGSLSLALADGAATTVDASAYTGPTTLDLTAANKLTTVTGGTNNDAITVDTFGLTANVAINGGAGVDVLTVSSNAGAASAFSITLTGGAGADNFRFDALDNVQAVDTNANLLKSLVTITDFTKALDVINVTVGAVRHTLDTLELSDIADEADLLAAASKAAGYTTAGEASAFLFGGDAYILVNNNVAGFEIGDGLVKVTGVTDLADFTATNFIVA